LVSVLKLLKNTPGEEGYEPKIADDHLGFADPLVEIEGDENSI